MSTLATAEEPSEAQLRERLRQFIENGQLTQGAAAQQLGISSSRLSLWLGNRYPGDNAAMAQRVEGFLEDAERRRVQAETFFETKVARDFATVARLIVQTADFALVYGDAGIGKTKAIRHYHAANATSALVTLSQWIRTAEDIIGALFHAENTRSYSGHEKRAVWLTRKFRDSGRLIIVDNAQRLGSSGLNFLFDWHDETNCPVILCGNPEIKDPICANDQRFRRVGIAHELRLDPAEKNPLLKTSGTARAALEMVRQIAPEWEPEIADLARQIASKKGHLGTLGKALNLARDIVADGSIKDPVEAVHAAHATLLTDYTL